MKIIIIVLLFFILPISSFSYQSCSELNNNLAKSECFKSSNKNKEALNSINKLQGSLLELETILSISMSLLFQMSYLFLTVHFVLPPSMYH